ncbi:MAG: TetR/AcrR family transcriptional regulator [Gammaproteobacteria bacterium]|nr:MAG: TetR/AcrR family transcriptional regulator [Gammaproteobacteria bacterium]
MEKPTRPGLRDRKFARTRLALAQAAIRHLDSAPLDTLSVRALCDQVQISEATFFNYFPRKDDLVAYLDELWSIELNWYGAQAALQQKGLAVIEALFRYTAVQIQKKPGLMAEIIAYVARDREHAARPEITVVERAMAFPDLEGIETSAQDNLETLFKASLQQAMTQGELPANTLIPAAMIGLVSIFYGVPLAIQHTNPASIGAMYRQQLELLWAGLRTAAMK